MCGIFLYFSPNPLNSESVNNALNALHAIDHRGPDGQGLLLLNTDTGDRIFLRDQYTPEYCHAQVAAQIDFSKYNCMMGHKRLSIFDLSENGFQPMTRGEDVIVFNGEIYNWAELRQTLEDTGEKFHTSTDTEVILRSFGKYGPEMVQNFNGMWAIIIWDQKNKKFFISRDRFGVKPVVYRQLENGGFVLGSEEKQILAFEGGRPEINYKNLEIFVNEGHIGFDQSTFYKGIINFDPASYAYAAPGDILALSQRRKYYTTQLGPYKFGVKNEETAVKEFNHIFRNAVDLRLRADVAAGFSLSGGLDSSRIVYEAAENEEYKFRPEFFSAVFPGSEVNEEHAIETIAEDLHIKPNFCYPDKEFSPEAFTQLTYVLDSPVPDLSYFAQWSVSALVNQHRKKILVVGQGADEVFAGYHHHFYRMAAQLMMSGKFARANKFIKRYADIKAWNFATVKSFVLGQCKAILKIRINKLLGRNKGSLSEKWNEITKIDELLLSDLTVYQIPYFLKADDRIGMWHGFESRYPFLDYRLVDFGFQCNPDLKIHDGWQKWIIRKSFTSGPQEIIWRKDKIGYKMPAHNWFENPDQLKEARESLSKHFEIQTTNTYRILSAWIWMKQYQ